MQTRTNTQQCCTYMRTYIHLATESDQKNKCACCSTRCTQKISGLCKATAHLQTLNQNNGIPQTVQVQLTFLQPPNVRSPRKVTSSPNTESAKSGTDASTGLLSTTNHTRAQTLQNNIRMQNSHERGEQAHAFTALSTAPASVTQQAKKTQSMAYFDSTCKSFLVGRRNLQGNHALARCCVNIAIGVKATSSTSWTEYQICRKSSTTVCHSFASLGVSSPARLLQPVCTQGKQVTPIVPRNSDKTSCCSNQILHNQHVSFCLHGCCNLL